MAARRKTQPRVAPPSDGGRLYRGSRESRRADAAAAAAVSEWEGLADAGIRLSPRELLNASGLAHRITFAPVIEAIAPGWRVDETDLETGEVKQDVTRDLDTALRLRRKLIDALGYARAWGGAWLWPVYPNNAAGDVKLRRAGAWPQIPPSVVHAISAREATQTQADSDISSPMFGFPAIVSMNLNRNGSAWNGTVSASHLVYVHGARTLPDSGWSGAGFADPQMLGNQSLAPGARLLGYEQSILSLYESAIVRLEASGSSVSRLLDRLSVLIYELGDGPGMGAAIDSGDPADDVRERMRMVQRSMRAGAIMTVLAGDKVAWAGPSLAGLDSAMAALTQLCCMVEGIPVTKFAGQSPGGLSTDDAAGRDTWHALLTVQRETAEEALLTFYDRVRGPNPTRQIVWPSLYKLTPQEQAAVSQAYAARDLSLATTGAIDPEEIRGRFADGEEVYEIVLRDDLRAAREAELEAVSAAPAGAAGVAAEPVEVDAGKLAGQLAAGVEDQVKEDPYQAVALARAAIEIQREAAEAAKAAAEAAQVEAAPKPAEAPAARPGPAQAPGEGGPGGTGS